MRAPTTLDALLVIAAFSRHAEALDWGERRAHELFGPIGLQSERYSFAHTAYYDSTMGADLQKQLWVFERLAPLDSLALYKTATIRLEEELAASGNYPEPRPLNLDPGFLNLGKFMLATTKDKDHRIYLRDGIFSEVTLRYCDKEYVPWPWTYADYRERHVRDFLNRTREYYKERLKELAEI
ncbi:MAG TPA: DUF4416 family protein [Gemmataceae bacterium]|nr:DUF4416 family protein [Gemmataceae bacterium]